MYFVCLPNKGVKIFGVNQRVSNRCIDNISTFPTLRKQLLNYRGEKNTFIFMYVFFSYFVYEESLTSVLIIGEVHLQKRVNIN